MENEYNSKVEIIIGEVKALYQFNTTEELSDIELRVKEAVNHFMNNFKDMKNEAKEIKEAKGESK